MVLSPCVGTCFYNTSGTYCIGCRRTPAEISDWFIMTDPQKEAVLERIMGKCTCTKDPEITCIVHPEQKKEVLERLNEQR